jgi:2-amino-4-hydroxy-6-hydroxymethyldihydropteridine diphosphokinase
MTFYLNIGSNLGDCTANLHHAIEALESALHTSAQVSSIIESQAWGYSSDNIFYNIGVAIDSDIAPQEMLTITQRIERELGSASHRNADGSYCDRLVDIDIIAVDDIVVNTPTLTIPHPLMHKREFVLAPMAELAPQWIHPTLHKSVAELINEL